MALQNGFPIHIHMHPPLGATGTCKSPLNPMFLLTALASLAALMQQLNPERSYAAVGSGCPSFGDSPTCEGGSPALRDFLGGRGLSPADIQLPTPSLCPGPGHRAPEGSPQRPDRRHLTGAASRPEGSPPISPLDSGSPAGDGGGLGAIDVARLVQALPPSRRESARTHFPIIIAEARRQGISSRPQLAYILATATHESGAGRRMVEMASGEAYEGRRGLGNTEPGDGPRFRGRGYVQLTGRGNYTAWSRRLGLDLVGDPSQAERPEVAARILVGGMRAGTFTRHRLDEYINERQTDFDGARRIIGSGRGAERVSEVAQHLLAAMS